jgi:hypothetical protein
MVASINASTSAGVVVTSDTSGSLALQTNSGVTALTIDTSQNISLTGGGQIRSNSTNTPVTFADSAGTQIGTLCRAWVNFDGTSSGTITPRGSFNVTSVTKNTTGVYTLNFTKAMPDTNYAVTGIVQYDQSGNQATHYLMGAEITNSSNAMQTGSLSVSGKYGGSASTYDMITFCVAVFR